MMKKVKVRKSASMIGKRTFPVLLLILSLLAGSLSTAGMPRVYASESAPETEADATPVSDDSLQSIQEEELPAEGEQPAGEESVTTDETIPQEEQPTGEESETTEETLPEEEILSEEEIPVEEETLPEEEVPAEEGEIIEEEFASEEGEEEIIVEEEDVLEPVISEALMAGRTLGSIEELDEQGEYDPTNMYGGVLPYPRGTKDVADTSKTGVPPEKTTSTKVLSGKLEDIAQWDHIWFGKPAGKVADEKYGQYDLYYDYGEKNYWLDHIRWRVLDPTHDNTALDTTVDGSLLKNDYQGDRADSGDAMFLMSEGLFGWNSSGRKNTYVISDYEKDFGVNKETKRNDNAKQYDYYGYDGSLSKSWIDGFTDNNFTDGESAAIRPITKNEKGDENSNSPVLENWAPHGNNIGNSMFEDGNLKYYYTTDSKGNKSWVFEDYYYPKSSGSGTAKMKAVHKFLARTNRKQRAARGDKGGLTDAKVFFLSASEALCEEYGFATTGKDYEGKDYTSGYNVRWTGRGDWQYDFGFAYRNYNEDGTSNGKENPELGSGDVWDTRLLEWRGYRDRGRQELPVPYTYGGSVSWRLRNYTANSGTGIVTGLSTTWYNGQGGVSSLSSNNPMAFRPGMNLEHKRIAFISEGENGKNEADAYGTNPTENGLTWLNLSDDTPEITASNTDVITNYKLTLKDENAEGYTSPRASFTASLANENSNDPEAEREIVFENAPVGPNEYVSCIIRDKDGEIRWYGRLAKVDKDNDGVEDGKTGGTISLSALGEHWRRGYSDQLYIFSEQHNPSRETDYISWPMVSLNNVDPSFCSDVRRLHWVVDPENPATAMTAQRFILANGAGEQITITDAQVYNVDENGAVTAEEDTSGRYVLSDDLTSGTSTIEKKDRSSDAQVFTVTLAGDPEDFEANTKPPRKMLVINASNGETLHIGLDYTVLREKYALFPAEATSEQGRLVETKTAEGEETFCEIDFGAIDPAKIEDLNDVPESTFRLWNHGRQDVDVAAEIIGTEANHPTAFSFLNNSGSGEIKAAAVGAVESSHTFEIGLTDNAHIDEGEYELTLRISVTPKETAGNPAEEFPDGPNVVQAKTYRVNVKYRVLYGGFRITRTDVESGIPTEAVSLGDYKPGIVTEGVSSNAAPYHDIEFRNTGKWAVGLGVTEISGADEAHFEVLDPATGNAWPTGQNGYIQIAPNETKSVRIRAVYSDVDATTYSTSTERKAMLQLRLYADEHEGHDDRLNIPVSFHMFPADEKYVYSPAGLNFGLIQQGALAGTQGKQVTITNKGAEPLELTEFTIEGAGVTSREDPETVLDGTGAEAFRLEPKPNPKELLAPGATYTCTVKLLSGLDNEANYSAKLKVNINDTPVELCDLALSVGHPEYEISMISYEEIDFFSDVSHLDSTTQQVRLYNSGQKPVEVKSIIFTGDDAEFQVLDFEPGIVQPKSLLVFNVAPKYTERMVPGETFKAQMTVECDPQIAWGDKSRPVSVAIQTDQYSMNALQSSLALGEIAPETFNPVTFNEEKENAGLVEFINNGHRTLTITQAEFADPEKNGFYAIKSIQTKTASANDWTTVAEWTDPEEGCTLPAGGIRLLVDAHLRILVYPARRILAMAGKDAVTDTLVVGTDANQLKKNLQIPVTAKVRRPQYLLVQKETAFAIGDFIPEYHAAGKAPAASVSFTNAGSQPVYLPEPSFDEGTEDNFTLTSITVNGTQQTSWPVKLEMDDVAVITVSAVRKEHTGAVPAPYTTHLTVHALKEASDDTTDDTLWASDSPYVIPAAFDMYAPEIAYETDPSPVSLRFTPDANGDGVEPGQIGTLSKSVSVRNLGRKALQPAEGGVFVADGTYFRAENFRVDGEDYNPETKPFAPLTTLTFDIRPVEKNEENTEHSERLWLGLKTVEAPVTTAGGITITPASKDESVRIDAFLRIPLPKHRVQAVKDGTALAADAALEDFGILAPVDGYRLPAAREIVMQNTGRAAVSVTDFVLQPVDENGDEITLTDGQGNTITPFTITADAKVLQPAGEGTAEADTKLTARIQPNENIPEGNYRVRILAQTDTTGASAMPVGTVRFEVGKREHHVIAMGEPRKLWDGILQNVKPEEDLSQQTITLQNIGLQQVTVTDITLTAGSDHFTLDETEIAGLRGKTLLPDIASNANKLQFGILPRDVVPDSDHSATVSVTTEGGVADFTFDLTLHVEKMPYVLENTGTAFDFGTLTPDDPAYNPDNKAETIEIFNAGREGVEITALQFTKLLSTGETDFEIRSVVNGIEREANGNVISGSGTTLYSAGGTADVNDILPFTLAAGTGMRLTVAPRAEILSVADKNHSDTLTVKTTQTRGTVTESKDFPCTLKVYFDRRDYEMTVLDNQTAVGADAVALSPKAYYPEQANVPAEGDGIPKKTLVIKNTGKKTLHLQPVKEQKENQDPAKITTAVTVGEYDYEPRWNRTLAPGEEAVLTVQALAQQGVTGADPLPVTANLPVLLTPADGTNLTPEKEAHIETTLSVTFDMYAKPYDVSVTSVAEGKQAHADFGIVGHEKLGTSQITPEKITITNTGRETLYPADGSGTFQIDTSGNADSAFIYGDGVITLNGQQADAFSPGAVLTFNVTPKDGSVLEEKKTYNETVTVWFAKDSAGTIIATQAEASARIYVEKTALRLEVDRTEIDFGVRNIGDELPAAEALELNSTGLQEFANVSVRTENHTLNGSAIEPTAFDIELTGVTTTLSGKQTIRLQPKNINLTDESTPTGLYKASILFSAEGYAEREIATVSFWVGARPYYVTADKSALVFGDATNQPDRKVKPENVLKQQQSIILTNKGTEDAQISVSIDGADRALFTVSPTSAEIPAGTDPLSPGTEQQMTLTVRPNTSVHEKEYEAVLVVKLQSEANHPAIRIPLTMSTDKLQYAVNGHELPSTEAKLLPDAITFAQVDPDVAFVADNYKQTAEISNTGRESVKITADVDGADNEHYDLTFHIRETGGTELTGFNPVSELLLAGKTVVLTVTPKPDKEGGTFTPGQKYTDAVLNLLVKETGTGEKLASAETALSYSVMRTGDALTADHESHTYDPVNPDSSYAPDAESFIFTNDGRNTLIISSVEIEGDKVSVDTDGDGTQEEVDVFEITGRSLVGKRLLSPDISNSPMAQLVTVNVRPNPALVNAPHGTYTGTLVLTAEGSKTVTERIPLTVVVQRHSYVPKLSDETVVFDDGTENDPELTGIEPENVLTATETLTITNEGRDKLTITSATFTGAYRDAFATKEIPAQGIELAAAGNTSGGTHEFEIRLTDAVDAEVKTREDCTYNAFLRLELLVGEGNGAVTQTRVIPVTCYVRQAKHRIAVKEETLELGTADYGYTEAEVSKHTKNITITNTGRAPVTFESIAFEDSDTVFRTGYDGETQKNLQPGQTLPVAVRPDPTKAVGYVIPESNPVKETPYNDTLLIKTTAATGGRQAAVAIAFRVREPHYQIKTSTGFIDLGEADAELTAQSAPMQTVSVSNIGNIEAFIAAEIKQTAVKIGETDHLLFGVTPLSVTSLAKQGTSDFRISVNVPEGAELPPGLHTAKLMFYAKESEEEVNARATQEVAVYLRVKEKPDPSVAEISLKAIPAVVDLGDAYNDYSDIEEMPPVQTVVLKNDGTDENAATVRWTAALSSGDTGVFTLNGSAGKAEGLAPGEEEALTFTLKQDESLAAGTYMAVVSVTATDTANAANTKTLTIPVMIRIKEKPAEEIKTFGISTNAADDAVSFRDATPLETEPEIYALTVTNTGTGTIRINAPRLEEQTVDLAGDDEGAKAAETNDKFLFVTGEGEQEKTTETLDDTYAVNLMNGESVTFRIRRTDSLQPGATYAAKLRIETDRVDVSKTLDVVFRVEDPRNKVTITPQGLYNFGEKAPADALPSAEIYTIKNEGNVILSLTSLTEKNGDQETGNYNITGFRLNNETVQAPAEGEAIELRPADTLLFTVQPKADLPAGSYTRNIVFETNVSGMDIVLPVTFRVREAVVSREVTGNGYLGTVAEGYTAADAAASAFTVKNTGEADILWTDISAEGADWLEIRNIRIGRSVFEAEEMPFAAEEAMELGAGKTLSFEVVPKTGLSVGRYQTKITVKTDKEDIVFPVNFRVKTPGAEVLSSDKESLSFLLLQPMAGEALAVEDMESAGFLVQNNGDEEIVVTAVAIEEFPYDQNHKKPLLNTGTAGTTLQAKNDPDGSSASFTVKTNHEYQYTPGQTLTGLVIVKAQEAADPENTFELEIPVQIRMSDQRYSLAATPSKIDLGEVTAVYEERDIETGTLTIRNTSTHAADLFLLPMSEAEREAFRLLSYQILSYAEDPENPVAGEEIDLSGKETETIEIPGFAAGDELLLQVTARTGLPDTTRYNAILRFEARLQGSDRKVAEEEALLTFYVSDKPADAYRVSATQSVTFDDLEPKSSPVEAAELAKIAPRTIEIKNTGSWAIDVSDITLTPSDYFTLEGAEKQTIAPGETMTVTARVKSGDNLFTTLAEETYTATVQVTLGMKTEVNGVRDKTTTFSVPLSFRKKEHLPEGIWMEEIQDYRDTDGDGVEEACDYVYTGEKITPPVEVFFGREDRLNIGDYTVSYKNNVNAYPLKEGDPGFDAKKAPTITIKGKGNYKGSFTRTFTIQPVDIEDALAPFEDAQEKLEGSDITVPNVLLTANGKVQTPKVALTYVLPSGKVKKLAVGKPGDKKDYYFDAANPELKEPGLYTIKVKGQNNFTGKKELLVQIVSANKTGPLPIAKAKIASIPAQKWKANTAFVDFSGEVQTAEQLTGTYGNGMVPQQFLDKKGQQPFVFTVTNTKTKQAMTQGVDYFLTYENNDRVGTASVTVTAAPGNEDFYGSVTKSFKINGDPIGKVPMTKAPKKQYDYTGAERRPEIAFANGLVEGTHYTVTYLNNKNPGTATVLITGLATGGYSGTVKKTFKIVGYPINDGKISATLPGDPGADGKYRYRKGGVKARPEVVFTHENGDTETLVEGSDYKLSWKGQNPKTVPAQATVVITGMGRFSGKREAYFPITTGDMDKDVIFTAGDVVWKANAKASKALKPVLTVIDADSGTPLKQGTDFYAAADKKAPSSDLLLKYYYVSDGTEVGPDDLLTVGTEYRVVLHGKGLYDGKTMEATFRCIDTNVKKSPDPSKVVSDVSKAKVTILAQQWKRGDEVRLTERDLTVMIGKQALSVGILREGETMDPKGPDCYIIDSSYANNKYKGTAKVTIRGNYGKGFGGAKIATFKIDAKQLSYTVILHANDGTQNKKMVLIPYGGKIPKNPFKNGKTAWSLTPDGSDGAPWHEGEAFDPWNFMTNWFDKLVYGDIIHLYAQ